jgi:hypothetical protein
MILVAEARFNFLILPLLGQLLICLLWLLKITTINLWLRLEGCLLPLAVLHRILAVLLWSLVRLRAELLLSWSLSVYWRNLVLSIWILTHGLTNHY